jgi:predicted class III extradiol MEMO1 family dioxygenase
MTPPTITEFFTDLDQIQDFKTVSISTDAVALKWRRPTANITHYDLTVHDLKDKTSFLKEIAKADTTFNLNGLLPGRRYKIIIKPHQGLRTSENCYAEVYIMTSIPPPENVLFEVFTPNYVVLTWDFEPSATSFTVSCRAN